MTVFCHLCQVCLDFLSAITHSLSSTKSSLKSLLFLTFSSNPWENCSSSIRRLSNNPWKEVKNNFVGCILGRSRSSCRLILRWEYAIWRIHSTRNKIRLQTHSSSSYILPFLTQHFTQPTHIHSHNQTWTSQFRLFLQKNIFSSESIYSPTAN